MPVREKLANLTLGGALAFCSAGFLFTLYRSELYPGGTLKIYYFIFGGGIILFALTLRLVGETKVNLALTIISISSAIYLAETYLLFSHSSKNNYPPNYAFLAQQHGVPFDTRTKYQVIMNLREKGIETYPEVKALFFESNGQEKEDQNLYAFGNIADKTIVHCNENGEYAIFSSDEFGFNNPKGFYKKGDLDVLLVGDSFAEGSCVKPGKDIASQLRRNDRTVLTVGTSGNGPLIELATLREYGRILQPKKVLWMYYEGNDLEDLFNEEKSLFLRQYLQHDFTQGLFERQREINIRLKSYFEEALERQKAKEQPEWANDFILAKMVKLYELRKLLHDFAQTAPLQVPPLFSEILGKAKEQVTSWGGELYFVYLPDRGRYIGAVNHDKLLHRGRVLAVVDKLKITTIDFHQSLIAHPDPLSIFPFRMHGHYNAEGYRQVAQLIELYLENE